ncbi:hypothetical protein GCM10010495_65470 [Kitasatospora herbaricolor]|nr:hypothetical protein GCM10010495_65470 [Kitasatospora herbaricolor]
MSGADQYGDQSRQAEGAVRVVRVAGGPQRPHFVQAYSFHLQDVGENQQRQAGVAVRVGAEEGDVEVRPGPPFTGIVSVVEGGCATEQGNAAAAGWRGPSKLGTSRGTNPTVGDAGSGVRSGAMQT